MSLDLVRVDDRLIHGQVVVGWGRELQSDLIVLADDEVAANEWEQELYCMGAPVGMKVEFTTVEDAAGSVDRWAHSDCRTIILVSDIGSLERLCNGAPSIRKVNLGGVHNEGDRHQHLPYLFLSDAEVVQLRSLAKRGIDITAQDLPTAAPVELAAIL
jgi:PTS system mannose-specific IIB component/fructoselysine and glucoselysine-specific PTS system IIB component